MMRLAEEDGVIDKTPCRRISLPAMVGHERRYLSAADVERLAAEFDPRYRALIHTAAYLGLRWQEIAGLRLRYLELERGRPAMLRVISTIERSGGRCRVVDLGKTKAARRTLVMPEFLRGALADHVAKYSDEEWVFAARKGGFLRYDNFRTREWSPAVESAGLTPLTFHCLRHTAAAFMIDDGADPLQLKRRMGHSDVRPSLDTYGHLFAQREDALVNALDDRREAAVVSLRSGDLLVTPPRRTAASAAPRSGDLLVTASRHPAASTDRETAFEQRL